MSSGTGPRFYDEPPQEIIHLYDHKNDGCWYPKEFERGYTDFERTEALNWENDQLAHKGATYQSPGQFKHVEVENPKHIQAMKDGKAPMDKLPLRVLSGDARVHQLGADKYGERNWRRERIKASTYEAAIMRHFIAHFSDREDRDPESGLSHLYHIRACCAVMIDAEIHDMLIDDRDRAETHG